MANGDNLPYNGSDLDVVPFTPITSEWGDGIGEDLLALAGGTGFDAGAITDPDIGGVSAVKITNPYKFFAYRTGSLASTSSATEKIALNTELFDTNNNFNTTTAQYTAPVTGVYSVFGRAVVTAPDYFVIHIRKNGTTILISGNQLNQTTTITGSAVSGLIQLTAGDTIELCGQVGTGTGKAYTPGADQLYFGGHLVSI